MRTFANRLRAISFASYAGFSKLLGWPALVQHDLQMFDSHAAVPLLLQVDHYCNGEIAHYWGPGGSLFYVLPEADLRAQDFARCELEGQFTQASREKQPPCGNKEKRNCAHKTEWPGLTPAIAALESPNVWRLTSATTPGRSNPR
jgi:hypothetical protein